ncbi:unnamed protein product [Rhodiola kirilowii]
MSQGLRITAIPNSKMQSQIKFGELQSSVGGGGMDDSDVRKIRNICILAHVDHGKTTLADHLIAGSIGSLLNPKQAGKLRVMDYLDEEQRRAITMKTRFSTAARLSDGALVLVDAVEGVHIQTHAVLRQAWIEKIDRLICELRLTPMEAYNRLARIVHEVNGIMSAYKSEKFQPQKGNVAFVCALDGWGFTINEFAEFYASKLGLVQGHCIKRFGFVLEPLWQVYQSAVEPDGDKAMLEKVIKSFNLSIPPRELQNKDPKFVLQAVMSRWLPISDSILSMVIRSLPDPITAQSFRVSRLIPKREALVGGGNLDVLAEAESVRKSVELCNLSPDAPCVIFVSKMFAVPAKMLPRRDQNGEMITVYNDEGGSESDECFLAFARIFSGVLQPGQKLYVLSALYDPLREESMEKHVQEAVLQDIYLMMGQGLKPVASAKAGNIVAIRGLAHHILKSATLSSVKKCWPFSSMAFQVAPTLRVAIEPSDPSDMGALMKGLRLLNRADPFVEVTVSSRGEHVLAAAGEVHLERCIKDLKERFAKVRLEVSPPLVSYRETIEAEPPNPSEISRLLSGCSDYVEKTTPNGRCVVRVHAMKLPPSLTKVLDENADVLSDLIGGKQEKTNKLLEIHRPSVAEDEKPVVLLTKRIMEALENDIMSGGGHDKDHVEKCKAMWLKLLGRIWAFGPRQIGPNILLTPTDNVKDSSSVVITGSSLVSEKLGFVDSLHTHDMDSAPDLDTSGTLYLEAKSLESSVASGFQLAAATGPLCDEPLWGLAFLVEAFISPLPAQQDDEANHHHQENHGIFTGQVMTAVKDACRAAVLQKNPRLVEAMYFCELNTPTEHLGSLYAVLSRRRARVLKEEMQEGSPLFTVHAYVPVAESYGFADELRRWTSGAASALLVLSHWEAIPEDPFFVPKTEDEIEEFGDGSSVLQNTARKLIDAVRRRKGLPVEEKVVQHATKQRTRARKV